MKIVNCFVVLAVMVSVAFASPTSRINDAVAKLQCVSDVIAPFDRTNDLGDLWLPIYFPLIMHSNDINACIDQNDECVDEAMESSAYTVVNYLNAVHENHSDIAEDMLESIVSNCEFELPSEMHIPNEIDINKINLKKFFNINHLICVTNAIATTVADSELALQWIKYHIELKKSISRIRACSKQNPINKKICTITELRTTFTILLDLWQFLSEKKHVQVLREIKGEIKSKCYSESLME